MSMTFGETGPGQAGISTRHLTGFTGFVGRHWEGFQAYRKRQRVRAELRSLKDWELLDIGIGRGEIDYVASNPEIEPRGVRSAE